MKLHIDRFEIESNRVWGADKVFIEGYVDERDSDARYLRGLYHDALHKRELYIDTVDSAKIAHEQRVYLSWLPESKSPEYSAEKVIFNEPATIVYWKDKTKTIVKCQDGDVYDKEKGLALCYMKKMLGNGTRAFNDALHKGLKGEDYGVADVNV